jgi:hypothetical protein
MTLTKKIYMTRQAKKEQIRATKLCKRKQGWHKTKVGTREFGQDFEGYANTSFYFDSGCNTGSHFFRGMASSLPIHAHRFASCSFISIFDEVTEQHTTIKWALVALLVRDKY